jgi:hypothetical protein
VRLASSTTSYGGIRLETPETKAVELAEHEICSRRAVWLFSRVTALGLFRRDILPPWEAIYVNDAARDQSFAGVVDMQAKLVRWYRSCAYALHGVPRLLLCTASHACAAHSSEERRVILRCYRGPCSGDAGGSAVSAFTPPVPVGRVSRVYVKRWGLSRGTVLSAVLEQWGQQDKQSS